MKLKPCPICNGLRFIKGILDPVHFGYDECITCRAKLPVDRRNDRPGEQAARVEGMEEARAALDGMYDVEGVDALTVLTNLIEATK